MNQKQFQLITLFTSSEKKQFTHDELSKILEVGKRSVSNYIADINDFLTEHDFHTIQVTPDNSLQLDSSFYELQLIREKYFSRPLSDYHFSSEERITIMKILLFKQDIVSTSNFIYSLDISKKTCLSDMKVVAKDLANIGVILQASTQGYQVDATEIYRRDYLINIFFAFLNTSENNSSFPGINFWVTKKYNMKLFRKQLFPILLNWQKENNITIKDYQFYQLLWILAIIIDRIKEKHFISNFPCNLSTHSITASESLYGRLSKLFLIEVPIEEIHFFASYLEDLSLISQPQSPLGSIPSNAIIHAFLVNISHDLKMNLTDDNSLYTQLSLHIKSFFSLIERNTSFDQSIFKDLEENYPKICQSIKNNLYILEQSFHRIYNQSEVGFLVMHIAAAVSKILSEQHELLILLVCDSNSTTSYITNKLNYYCNVKNIDMIPSFEYESYMSHANTPPDLIITVEQPVKTTLPIVSVSPVLSHSDLTQIQNKIYEIKKKEDNLLNKKSASKLKSTEKSMIILSPDYVSLDVEASSWRNALSQSGNVLKSKNLINQNYIELMISNVENNGAYFVFWPRVALAHANIESKSISFSASFTRLKEPICFGNKLNDPVQYIFTFIASDIEKNYDKIIDIIKLASSPTLFQHIDQAKTVEEVYRLIHLEELNLL